ncbi:MAG: S-layer homology domain-containing protein [Clostridia bacterium]|nr:S-layer homology domain-containing protein [Clostridia bacterium]
MFKKLHTTGRNNSLSRILAFVAALALLAGMPLFSYAEETEYSLSVSGFELDFDVHTDYYLALPENFETCSIDAYTGFKTITVSVEQYATYFPYQDTAYKLGEPLKLGQGRAKVTVTATLKDGSAKEYLIALADPNGADYAYARARVTSTVNVREQPSTDSNIIKTLVNNARVYYLKSEGDWCMVQLINHINGGKIGYIHKDYLRWGWLETEMPAQYAEEIAALQAAHPNWTFSFVDVEMTYAEALEKYGSANEQYINPLYYLQEDKIFALLDIDSYTPDAWTDDGIAAIWVNENAISKANAVSYFNAASESLLMNPYYIACRAALESGYGTSKYAKGMSGVTINDQYVDLGGTYYNLYGIGAYDHNPNNCMLTARDRNWNSLRRSIVEGANWVKDQYLDQGATTPYFFRFAGFQNKVYMTDVQAPLKEASILKRAYTDPNATAHFIIPVYADLIEPPVLDPFTDIDPEAWYYDEVSGAVEAGLFNGMSDTYFGVSDSITRAQFVTAIARLCGETQPTNANDHFTDVPADQWYYSYVCWAYEKGLVNGISETEFAPEKPITRQEMCKMMGTAIEYLKSAELSAENAKTFADLDQIADWAKTWVDKCSANGIFNGDQNNFFHPEDNANRAEAAAVFYRCYQQFVEPQPAE